MKGKNTYKKVQIKRKKCSFWERKKKKVLMQIYWPVTEQWSVWLWHRTRRDLQIVQWIWKFSRSLKRSRSLEPQTQITPVASCNTQHFNELYCRVLSLRNINNYNRWNIILINANSQPSKMQTNMNVVKIIYFKVYLLDKWYKFG